MKLRNKKTGKIFHAYPVIRICDGATDICFNSLARLNEEFEDYKPKDPLIKDEKIRKAVRAWAEANDIDSKHYYDTDVEFDRAEHRLTWINTIIEFNKSECLENLEDGETYTINELCGEEE